MFIQSYHLFSSFFWDLWYIIYLDSSEDPHKDVAAVVSKYSSQPESEPQLKLLLPHIASTFGANKSVSEIYTELRKHQQSSDDIGILLLWFLLRGRILCFLIIHGFF